MISEAILISSVLLAGTPSTPIRHVVGLVDGRPVSIEEIDHPPQLWPHSFTTTTLREQVVSFLEKKAVVDSVKVIDPDTKEQIEQAIEITSKHVIAVQYLTRFLAGEFDHVYLFDNAFTQSSSAVRWQLKSEADKLDILNAYLYKKYGVSKNATLIHDATKYFGASHSGVVAKFSDGSVELSDVQRWVLPRQLDTAVSLFVERELYVREAERFKIELSYVSAGKERLRSVLLTQYALAKRILFHDPLFVNYRSSLSFPRSSPDFHVPTGEIRKFARMNKIEVDEKQLENFADGRYVFGSEEDPSNWIKASPYARNALACKSLASFRENLIQFLKMQSYALEATASTAFLAGRALAFLAKSPASKECPILALAILTPATPYDLLFVSNKTIAAARIAFWGHETWASKDSYYSSYQRLFARSSTAPTFLAGEFEQRATESTAWLGAERIAKELLAKGSNRLDLARRISELGLFSDEIFSIWAAERTSNRVQYQVWIEGNAGAPKRLTAMDAMPNQLPNANVAVEAYLRGFDVCRVAVHIAGEWVRICPASTLMDSAFFGARVLGGDPMHPRTVLEGTSQSGENKPPYRRLP